MSDPTDSEMLAFTDLMHHMLQAGRDRLSTLKILGEIPPDLDEVSALVSSSAALLSSICRLRGSPRDCAEMAKQVREMLTEDGDFKSEFLSTALCKEIQSLTDDDSEEK